MKRCHFCGTELEIDRVVGRDETCPRCMRDLRCCLNCGMYDPGAANYCREPQSEEVRDRDRSNFCEFFIFVEKTAKNTDRVTEAKKQWEELFKK